jgi:hypothetical protein
MSRVMAVQPGFLGLHSGLPLASCVPWVLVKSQGGYTSKTLGRVQSTQKTPEHHSRCSRQHYLVRHLF